MGLSGLREGVGFALMAHFRIIGGHLYRVQSIFRHGSLMKPGNYSGRLLNAFFDLATGRQFMLAARRCYLSHSALSRTSADINWRNR